MGSIPIGTVLIKAFVRKPLIVLNGIEPRSERTASAVKRQHDVADSECRRGGWLEQDVKARNPSIPIGTVLIKAFVSIKSQVEMHKNG
jgi:hypothetical protein